MQDLGFTYQARGNDFVIYRQGMKEFILRGKKATNFSFKIETLDSAALQIEMAKITGNYKRGNEKHAKDLANSKKID
ncbi:hypothetical protein NBRC116493_34440 [Aurantivibrio infirmus]